MERMRVEREGEEAALAATMHSSKKKLLNDLAEDEAKREADVKKLQQLRDEEKKTLFTSLSSGKKSRILSNSYLFFKQTHFFHSRMPNRCSNR